MRTILRTGAAIAAAATLLLPVATAGATPVSDKPKGAKAVKPVGTLRICSFSGYTFKVSYDGPVSYATDLYGEGDGECLERMVPPGTTSASPGASGPKTTTPPWPFAATGRTTTSTSTGRPS